MEEDQTNWEETGENVPIDPKGIVFLGRSNCVTAAQRSITMRTKEGHRDRGLGKLCSEKF